MIIALRPAHTRADALDKIREWSRAIYIYIDDHLGLDRQLSIAEEDKRDIRVVREYLSEYSYSYAVDAVRMQYSPQNADTITRAVLEGAYYGFLRKLPQVFTPQIDLLDI
jgi:hypothetical protein